MPTPAYMHRILTDLFRYGSQAPNAATAYYPGGVVFFGDTTDPNGNPTPISKVDFLRAMLKINHNSIFIAKERLTSDKPAGRRPLIPGTCEPHILPPLLDKPAGNLVVDMRPRDVTTTGVRREKLNPPGADHHPAVHSPSPRLLRSLA